jgi:hypothetical protein
MSPHVHPPFAPPSSSDYSENMRRIARPRAVVLYKTASSALNFIIIASIAAGFWCAYLIRRLWVWRKFYQKAERT